MTMLYDVISADAWESARREHIRASLALARQRRESGAPRQHVAQALRRAASARLAMLDTAGLATGIPTTDEH